MCFHLSVVGQEEQWPQLLEVSYVLQFFTLCSRNNNCVHVQTLEYPLVGKAGRNSRECFTLQQPDVMRMWRVL